MKVRNLLNGVYFNLLGTQQMRHEFFNIITLNKQNDKTTFKMYC